ncbi:MAG: hypothetical protein ACE5I5_20755 [Candidatus Heimdallarchaeota archaeon]
MPKRDFEHTRDGQLDEAIKSILLKFFDHKIIEELECNGGRISISIKTNRSGRRKKSRKKSLITDTLISELDNLKHSSEQFLSRLEEFNKADLLKLSRMLNQPIRSSAKVDEIKNEILRSFRSEDIWKGISGRED